MAATTDVLQIMFFTAAFLMSGANKPAFKDALHTNQR